MHLTFNFNIYLQQNIDVDIGRVIAKVSSQANPTTSVKGSEQKKEKKKGKQSARDAATEHKDIVSQGASVEILIVNPTKDKKKKKLKKTHSSTTSTAPETSILEEQPGNAQGVNDNEPQGINKGTTQNILRNHPLEHNNESSNSCFQPPPIMVCLLSFPYLKYIVKQLSSSFNILVSFLSLSDTCLNHTRNF
jgi:hypothetical protein